MYTVIVEVDTGGAEREEARRRLREEIVPSVKQAPGFQSGTWTHHPTESKGLSLMTFDTEDHANAVASRFQPGASPQPGVTIERAEVREVVETA